jgi:ribosomal protein S18 acetylase RimI-like enzyme
VTAATSPDGATGTVRPATPADADEIAAVHVATWRHAYAGLLPDDVLAGLDVTQRADRWRERISGPRSGIFVLVFEQFGRIRGFVCGGPSRDGEGGGAEAGGAEGGGAEGGGAVRTGEVYAIYVDPACQGQGAGTRLLGAAARLLAQAGFTGASLWVLADNHPSRRFYESRGWRPDGSAKPWSYGDGGSVMEVRYVKP